MKALQAALDDVGMRHGHIPVLTTDALGVPPHQVEPLAFAWLAMRCMAREPAICRP